MVQLYEVRPLLKKNTTYARVFTVILSTCELGKS